MIAAGCSRRSPRAFVRATRRRGFTLFEMMMVLIIMTILAGVVLPGAHTFDDQRLTGVMRLLAADIEFAQARAIATSQVHRLLFDVVQQEYRVESPPGVPLDEPLKKSPWVRSMAGGMEILSADFDGSSALTFDGAGTPTDGGSVTISLGDFAGTASVAAVTGHVKLVLP